MAPRPVLGELELEKVQSIVVDGDQVLVEHGVPALEGDFLQRLGRRAGKINLRGFLAGSAVLDSLKELRDKLRAAEPVSFVADIVSATRVDQVLIEEMGVRELAGKPERFEYVFLLREFIPPPPTERERPPAPIVPPPPSVVTGILIVDVIVEGQPNFDFSKVTVTVEGTEESGATLSRTLTNRTENRWTENEFPPGDFTVEALVSASDTMSDSALAAVRAGQTTQVSITLRTGSTIAKTFVVHFRFDKAFVEPCMREVLKQVESYAEAHADEKLLVVGHTDKAGSPGYNQSLSERRARSVFAYITFGIDDAARDAALAEWDQLRRRRTPGQTTSINDTWDVREYQHILQDLGFYPVAVDGDHGPLTDDAVRAYRCAKGLPDGTTVDDEVWDALIQDYLTQDRLAVPVSRLFPNCPNEQLKWLGCGEEDPLDRRGTAFRPSRRVELLFVQTDRLPCEVPQPDTFDLPPPGGVVNSAWCLGPGSTNAHSCFVSLHLVPATNNPQPCPNTPQGPWCRQPADPGTITVNGSIQRELADGSLEPVPNQAFVLTSPKGEFKASEQTNGEPVPGRTQGGTGPDRGNFTFADLTKGFYHLEVRAPATAPVLVRLLEDSDSEVKGNAVCKALHSDQDRLDVVIINAPAMREIRLPVAVHLMTALHPTTRAVRTCPDPLNPARRVPQATARTEADVQAFFDAANRIWRQARIRFELDAANIVHETYAFRTECQVDESEFVILLERCAYPDAVNVFFIADLAGTSEAGFGVSPEGGAALGVAGCAVGDRFQTTVLGPPINVSLSDVQTEQVLAHELGHFLNLDHVDDIPTNTDRLMLPGTLAGSNRTLTPDEVNNARASQGATDDCVPLSLTVEGATQIGGTLSHQFIFVQHPELIDPFDITIDASIPNHLLATGTITMTGGNPGASNLQRTVSKSTTGEFEIVATYTPDSGGKSVQARVVIYISTFRQLRVEGDRVFQVGGAGSTAFVGIRNPNPNTVVTIVAELDPVPFCVSTNLVIWTGGDLAPDPLRRTVSQHQIGVTTVTATLPGVGNTRSVNIFVVRLTLDVDADRDGIVEEDAEGKETWEWGAGMTGATLLCNNDNDNKPDGNTTIDKDNSVVDGTEDINDLASLIVRQTGPLPAGLSLFLTTGDQSKVRIFDDKTTSGTAIIGPSPLPTEFQLNGADTAALELGCEGLEYPTDPSSPNDGIIDLSLILREGVIEHARDNVQLRVAPWLMLSHMNETEEVYVVETSDNASFVSTLDSILASLSIPLRRTSNVDRWMQDTMEIGYSRTAGQELNVILKAVRRRELSDYARDNLLGRNYGYVEVTSSTSANTFDSHGNLEVSPPVQVGGTNFQFGRIYYGSGRSSQPFNTDIEVFLQAQRVQKPFSIDTGWLAVGHVDEVISFVPSELGSKGYKILFADTNDAINLLTDLSNLGHGSVNLFQSKAEEITIDNLLSDLSQTSIGDLGWANNICQNRLDGVRSVMVSELGLEASDIVTIPSLFVENPRSPRRINSMRDPVFDALIPAMINMLVITKPSIADSHLVAARPFGPVVGGVDQLEQAFRDKLSPSGYTATQIHFIDDYDTYHIRLGEVHCGTNSKRKPGALPWWEQTDF